MLLSSKKFHLNILHPRHICLLSWLFHFLLGPFVQLILLHRSLEYRDHRMKTSTKNESSFLHHVFKFCHAWPGPKPAKRPSECFGFLGLLDGPAAGGPEMDDCLGKICYGVPEIDVCLEIRFLLEDCLGKTLSDQTTVLTCWKPTSVLKVSGSCGWPVMSCWTWTSWEVSVSEIENKK